MRGSINIQRSINNSIHNHPLKIRNLEVSSKIKFTSSLFIYVSVGDFGEVCQKPKRGLSEA